MAAVRSVPTPTLKHFRAPIREPGTPRTCGITNPPSTTSQHTRRLNTRPRPQTAIVITERCRTILIYRSRLMCKQRDRQLVNLAACVVVRVNDAGLITSLDEYVDLSTFPSPG